MIIAALWFFLPAGLANAAPVFAASLFKNFDEPLDMGKTYRGKRVFGDNKTWRGLMAGIITATAVVALQKYLFDTNIWAYEHSWIDYRGISPWVLGPLFGAGALLADALESFFKRQRGIEPGNPWIPFDQTDYIIGGCLLSLLVVRLPASYYVWILITWFGMHMLTVYIGYLLGVRDKPI